MQFNFSEYTGVHYDSRQVKPGYIFVAIRGEKFDANDFIQQAIANGAKLVISEKPYPEFTSIQVSDARLALAEISAGFYGNPSNNLELIGVTGTNGKTTVTHLIQGILADKKCALLGTIGLKLFPGAEYKDLGNTTPQSLEIQQILADLVQQSYKYLTMEVSSHALDQKRVWALDYKTMIVTNLTQDHLDYHLTMDSYFEAKAKAFDQTKNNAILNVDDPYYERFRAKAESKSLHIISFGVNNPADLKASNLKFGNKGLSYQLDYRSHSYQLSLRLNGLFNVYNSLAAIAAALQEGLSIEFIIEKLASLNPVAGRFETVQIDNSPLCIVDYAHSPDGLYNVLIGAKALLEHRPGGRLICVFGCGGDRDITKRPKMGKIAYDLADLIYVTSDNPRSEDPQQIIADILAGIPNMSKVQVNPSRSSAIEIAIKSANSSDIVVVAGKGHENYQILKDKTIHFDDKEEVTKVISSCTL